MGKILRVPREGTRSVIGKTCSAEFVALVSKLLTTKCAGIFKKMMKSEYQLVFDFVNKTLLPRIEKRTSATSADLFMMELLCRFESLNLPGLILEHMYKTVIERKEIHGMGYGYFLNEVFKHFKIPLSVGKVGTMKQAFSKNTLVECECIEGKGNPKSKMAQLIEDQDQLKHEVEELTMCLSGKDTEIAILKAELLTAQTEGPGSAVVQALERENAKQKAKVIGLQEKAIKDNDDANARHTLIIQSLSHQPLPFIVLPIIFPCLLCLAYLFVLGFQFGVNVLNINFGILFILFPWCSS